MGARDLISDPAAQRVAWLDVGVSLGPCMWPNCGLGRAVGEGAGVWEAELRVCERAIDKWPKGFQVWHHRRLVLQRLLGLLREEEGRGVVQRELQCLTRHLQQGDGKNHHAWTYRSAERERMKARATVCRASFCR